MAVIHGCQVSQEKNLKLQEMEMVIAEFGYDFILKDWAIINQYRRIKSKLKYIDMFSLFQMIDDVGHHVYSKFEEFNYYVINACQVCNVTDQISEHIEWHYLHKYILRAVMIVTKNKFIIFDKPIREYFVSDHLCMDVSIFYEV